MESVFQQHYKKHALSVPDFHFVLGSGFSPLLDNLKSKRFSEKWEEGPPLSFKDVPGLKTPTAPTHKGFYRYFTHKPTKKGICFQAGRLHGYEGYTAREVAQTVLLPRLAGTRKFILTNISGSLKTKILPGSVMALLDHVNFTSQNPLIGENPKNSLGKIIGPRFPDMKEIYSRKLTNAISKQLKKHLSIYSGVYIGVPGPSLETPSEVALFAKWGLTAVGMSTIFEAIALKHAGATVSAFSLISNFACGLKKDTLIQEESMRKIVNTKAPKILKSFFDFSHDYFTKTEIT